MTETEIINRVVNLAEQAYEVGMNPAILLSLKINVDLGQKLTTCHVDISWIDKIRELLEGGWIMFRTQTGPNKEIVAHFAKLQRV